MFALYFPLTKDSTKVENTREGAGNMMAESLPALARISQLSLLGGVVFQEEIFEFFFSQVGNSSQI